AGQLPVEEQVRDEPGQIDEIARTLSEDLERDVRSIRRLRVANLGDLHEPYGRSPRGPLASPWVIAESEAVACRYTRVVRHNLRLKRNRRGGAERGRAYGGDRRRRSDGDDVGGRAGVGGGRRRHRRAARRSGSRRLARRRVA